jgi:hypothetical protein
MYSAIRSQGGLEKSGAIFVSLYFVVLVIFGSCTTFTTSFIKYYLLHFRFCYIFGCSASAIRDNVVCWKIYDEMLHVKHQYTLRSTGIVYIRDIYPVSAIMSRGVMMEVRGKRLSPLVSGRESVSPLFC